MRRHPSLPAVVVAVTAALVLPGCGSSPPKERSSLTVFLDTDVTADQRTAVDQQLHGMPTMRDVAFKTKQQTYEEFKQKFKDAPDLVAATKPDSLPESFSDTADSRFVEAIETILTSSPGVDNLTVVLPSGTKPQTTAGMILQLRPEASADQRAAIESAVHALPEAKPARFESADAAGARLKKQCRAEAALAARLDRVSAFASYRFTFTITSKSLGSREYLALDQLPGIQTEVLVPAGFL